jgi:hypothetical protein
MPKEDLRLSLAASEHKRTSCDMSKEKTKKKYNQQLQNNKSGKMNKDTRIDYIHLHLKHLYTKMDQYIHVS